jgi:methylamine--corrinoid protein Co-methyltransferase
LAKELLKKYEDKIGDAPVGKKYQECYDISTGQPSQEYIDLYGEVKEELRRIGFNFKH